MERPVLNAGWRCSSCKGRMTSDGLGQRGKASQNILRIDVAKEISKTLPGITLLQFGRENLPIGSPSSLSWQWLLAQ